MESAESTESTGWRFFCAKMLLDDTKELLDKIYKIPENIRKEKMALVWVQHICGIAPRKGKF